jgi:hypothetical protein
MIYLFILFMACCGYYTFTYGMSLWRDDGNKLGAVSAMFVAVAGTVVPAAVMIILA